VVHVERELLFLRGLETTIVLDRLTTGASSGVTAASQVNTFILHSETNPTMEDVQHLTITNGTQVLRATTLVPAGSPRRQVVNEGNPGKGQYRIETDGATGNAQRYFLHVLQARDTSGSNLTASLVDSNPGDPTTGTFTVTLHPASGADTVVVFNKGQTSRAGTVNLAGAGALPLRTDVQPITYGDDGPAW
jgi:hypothetical protein